MFAERYPRSKREKENVFLHKVREIKVHSFR